MQARQSWGRMFQHPAPAQLTEAFMQNPKRSLRELQTLINSPVKGLPDRQSPNINVNATVPVGPTAAKVELGIGIEDGKVKPKFEAKLEGLLDGLLSTATADELANQAQEKRAACSGGYRQDKEKGIHPTRASTGRGRRDMMAR